MLNLINFKYREWVRATLHMNDVFVFGRIGPTAKISPNTNKQIQAHVSSLRLYGTLQLGLQLVFHHTGLNALDAEFDRPAGVTADVFIYYIALISGLQIATDVTVMGVKCSSQQAAINESDIKHDEHDTLPSVNTTLPVQLGHHVSRREKATDTLSLSSKAPAHDAFGASGN